jgi:hypothetical protein
MSAATAAVGGSKNDSKSLWNYTLSPGWTPKEVDVFRLALMKYGLGKWTTIVEKRIIPGKTVGQLNNQMQRMIGQQSTSEFQGLHIDPSLIFAFNTTREGKRKNGILVNTGENPTTEKVRQKRLANQQRWGLSQADIDSIVVPTLREDETNNRIYGQAKLTEAIKIEKLNRLRVLQEELESVRKRNKMSIPVATTTTMPISTTTSNLNAPATVTPVA